MAKKPEIGVMSHLKADASNLDIVADFGLKCAQVVSWDINQATTEIAQNLKRRSAETGVRLTAIWAGYSGPAEWNFTLGPVTLGLVPTAYRETRVRELKQWADFAAEAGAPAIITHCGFLPENMTDPNYEELLVAIKSVAQHCKSLGIGFWFETGQETPITLLRYFEAVGLDNLGINLDPANILMYGKGNPIDALDVFGTWVRAVHAKDGKVPTNGYKLGPEVKVGTGMVRYPEFVKKLLDIGFEGDLTIEREISGEKQNADIRDTITYLENLLG